MLASLGFVITAILLLLFAYSFDAIVKKSSRDLRPFGLAYALIGVAFLMWGMLSLFKAEGVLPHSVLVGDVLLIASSVCAALVFIPAQWKTVVIVGTAITTVLLIYIRSKYYYPTPTLKDGILYFQTQHKVAILLSIIVVATWLPACLKVARIITTKHGLQQYYTLFVSTYLLAIITATLFIQAHRKTVIIEVFIGFALSIVLLLLSNTLAINSGVAKAKHGSK